MTNHPRAVAYINLDILEENYRSIRNLLSPGVKLLCVVKADAYGHGSIEISKRLRSIGVDYLGVATVDEGVKIREAGIETPLLIMSGLFPWEETGPLMKYNLTPVVYEEGFFKRILNGPERAEKSLKVHIKFDTGMGRLGFAPSEAQKVARMAKSLTGVEVEGLMSHFSASETRDDYGNAQIEMFRKVIAEFEQEGLRPPVTHMANSGAVVNYPEGHFSMVRVGICLYGSHPSPEVEERLPLKQVMKVATRIAFLREFPSGAALSYGRTYVTDKPAKIAYIPVGYSDGYPRSLSNKGLVLINNRKCSIVGRVCMDWILADVTGLGSVKAGDEVILLGEGKEGERISANEMAHSAGTIPYEVLCKISGRVVRVYG